MIWWLEQTALTLNNSIENTKPLLKCDTLGPHSPACAWNLSPNQLVGTNWASLKYPGIVLNTSQYPRSSLACSRYCVLRTWTACLPFTPWRAKRSEQNHHKHISRVPQQFPMQKASFRVPACALRHIPRLRHLAKWYSNRPTNVVGMVKSRHTFWPAVTLAITLQHRCRGDVLPASAKHYERIGIMMVTFPTEGCLSYFKNHLTTASAPSLHPYNGTLTLAHTHSWL